MSTIRTSIEQREDARKWRFEPSAFIPETNAQEAIERVASTVRRYDTRAQAIAATIPAGVQAIKISRYATGYPVGEATYVPGTSAGPMAFQEAGGNWWQLDLNGGLVSALWFGAAPRASLVDTTNASAAIQAAMDTAIGLSVFTDRGVEVAIPDAEFGWGIIQLIYKACNLHLIGVGGPDNPNGGLKYIGTAASETAMLRAVRDTDHGGENFRGCGIRNLRVDGMGKALYGFKANGWTRYCNTVESVFTGSVCNLFVENGYYSRWTDVEVLSNPKGAPVGMNPATVAANKFGAYFDICHDMAVEGLKLTDLGGDFSTQYTAALSIRASNGVAIRNLSLETSRAANDRYLDRGIQIGAGTSVTIDGSYIENNDFTIAMIDASGDNLMLGFQGTNYLNDLKVPALIQALDLTPITFNGNVFGEGLNITDRVFKCTNGSKLKGVVLQGNLTLYSGPATGGSYYDANAVASKFGLPADAITSLLTDAAATTGTILTGYVPSIAANYITVTPGRAIINGWPVSNVRHTGLRQRLFPELAYVGSWYVKVNSLGCPVIEKQAAAQPGSAYSKTIATFDTTGGTNNPSNLVLV